MRLGQLARKINVKPVQIASFLEKEHNIIIESNLNTKIENESLVLVLDHFKIDEIIENVEEEIKVNQPIESEVVEGIKKQVDEIEISQEILAQEIVGGREIENVEEVETLTAIDEDGGEIELTVVDGVIKVPKKELEGFKVVGKIDLPEKKRSVAFIITTGGDSTDITEEIYSKKELVSKRKKELYLERKRKRQEKNKNKKGNQRKILSEIELKERANKLAVEKQIQKSKINKDLKKKRYEEKIKSQVITKKTTAKKKRKKQDTLDSNQKQLKKPTSTWGKIINWFNT